MQAVALRGHPELAQTLVISPMSRYFVAD
jgi:hypothetical protein